MTEHLSTTQLQGFRNRVLQTAELVRVAEHLASCQPCHRQLTEIFEHRDGGPAASINLSPTAGLERAHLESEQIRHYLDKRLDATEWRMVEAHMALCRACEREVRDLAEWDRRMTPLLQANVAKRETASSWWGGFLNALAAYAHWRPAQAFGAALACAVIVFAVLLFVRQDNPATDIAQSTKPTATTGGSGLVQPSSASPLTPPAPNGGTEAGPEIATGGANASGRAAAPQTPPSNRAGVSHHAARPPKGHDNATASATVGNPSEVANVPDSLRDEYVAARRGAEIERPRVLDEISDPTTSLRGSATENPTPRLLSPARTVLASDRPTFQWELLAGASSYQVQVFDAKFVPVAKSETLPPDANRWTPHVPLPRGIVLRWTINAVVDGNTVPWPSSGGAPEMKFKILSGVKLDELNQLRGASTPRLAQALFYIREGMLADAERELETLLAESPNSPAAAKLLRRVRSWR
jgi:hypothetical protein